MMRLKMDDIGLSNTFTTQNETTAAKTNVTNNMQKTYILHLHANSRAQLRPDYDKTLRLIKTRGLPVGIIKPPAIICVPGTCLKSRRELHNKCITPREIAEF